MIDKITKSPHIRLAGFNDAWEQRKLGEVVDVRSGRDYKHLSKGDIPVYGTGGYMLSVSEALSYAKDGIGIGRKGTINKPYILRAPFWTVDTLFYAVPKEKYDLEFVYSIFKRVNWKQKDESTGVPSLSKTTINEVHVAVPGYGEQVKIGSFFSQLDHLITLHQRKLELLKETKKSLLQKMFPKDGANFPEIRFAGFTDAWEQRKLGELVKLSSSKRVHREEYVEKGIPFFRGSEISKLGSSSKLDDVLFISQEHYKDLKNKYGVPQTGDILITAVGTLGNSFVISDNTPFYFKDGNLIWLSEIKVNSQFLNIYLGNGIGKKRVLESAAGSNQKALTMIKLENVIVPIPSENEQKKVGSFFKELDHLITLHQRELISLKNLNKSLLQQMFI
ncbi:restriction endonuclease subunit S [Bacillus sp. 0102A]|uniref:restriction endonuclease subunit S n=1 Tax=Bacillus sp. 0102A TaxID=3120563 RepID=UPI002FDAF2F5